MLLYSDQGEKQEVVPE